MLLRTEGKSGPVVCRLDEKLRIVEVCLRIRNELRYLTRHEVCNSKAQKTLQGRHVANRSLELKYRPRFEMYSVDV